MYVPYIILLYIFSVILTYPERTLVSAFVGLFLMINGYYFFHRALHILPKSMFNLHITIHHQKHHSLNRYVELFIDMIFEILIVCGVPLISQSLSNDWIIPYSIIWFVSLAFSLNHIFNYSFLFSKQHTAHHLSESTNFYPDFMDHIFGTNYDKEYEDMNQQIPSLIQACIITHFAKAYFQWKE